ncbi:hypothetical protein VDIAB_40129 [Vibrio diabolicus]|nr:hypothetical protein VDIAB_40129 [Vibrio diabolicus]
MKLSELQSHIKEFDYAPEQSEHYFFKLNRRSWRVIGIYSQR